MRFVGIMQYFRILLFFIIISLSTGSEMAIPLEIRQRSSQFMQAAKLGAVEAMRVMLSLMHTKIPHDADLVRV